ncbi:hypothetical protein [Naasia sp.]|uniref:hypothetical protein n=1 Tax=Naasia sp. TaxID=2546198 RepID=UPI002608605A|nr:hypothetical protein [Naasia sp.]
MTKTIQLRRYELEPSEYDAFLEWWQSSLVALRARSGFAIEFAYADRERSEFVWAVSVPGDAEDFARVEAEYLASDARREVFDGLPQRIRVSHIALVEALPVAS